MMIWTDISTIITPYLGLILLIGIGVLAAWRHILTPELINQLSEIILILIIPVFVFWNAASGSIKTVISQAPWMFGIGLCSGFVGYAFASAIARIFHWEWPQRAVLLVSGVTGNTGFLGIPICAALYGSQGTILAVLFDLGASIYLFTLGIGAFQNSGQFTDSSPARKSLLIKQIFNPIFIALLLGVAISLSDRRLPSFLEYPLNSLSNTAIPIMMLILGGLIYNTYLDYHVGNRKLIFLSLFKLIILPLLTWVAILSLPLTDTSREIAVVQAAMPSAIMAATLAARYNADASLAANATMITTLVSMLTIPIFAFIVH